MMLDETQIRRKLKLERMLLKMDAPERFCKFIPYVNPAYSEQWFHRVIAEHCQMLLRGIIRKLMVFVPPQHGKLLADDTEIPTPTGFKRHGDLRVGDYVFGRDGKPAMVQAVSEKGLTAYRVWFSDGTCVDCHGRHEWAVYNRSLKRESVYETEHLARLSLESGTPGKRGHRYIFQIDAPRVIQYPKKEVGIDAYTLGAWLGDGKSSEPQITIGCGDREIIARIPYRHTSHWVQESTGVEYYYYGNGQIPLSKYGLFGNKHIPDDYIFNSVSVRKDLVAGLIDTDGYVYARNGRVTITNTNKDVIDSLSQILRSLGETPVITEYPPAVSSSGIQGKKTVYQLCFNPVQDYPTAVPRKRVARTVMPRRRAIVKIEKAEGKPGNCIQVDGGVYLVGRSFIPTHNSEIVSRCFPAWALGRNPDLKIVGCSYSAVLAQQFSRSIQRIIDSKEYKEIFPGTFLNGSNVRTDTKGYLRNVDLFEVVNRKGFYKCVGVGGSLTGTPVDIAIIDDPVKDALEAYSPVYRERVWDWYTSVLLTRLHNDSRQLFIMTRWHDDDLAGRILKQEAEQWTVLSIPAVRESTDDGNASDPRGVGEALWPERHSLERLLAAQRRSPRFFSALYQQSPTVEGGNIVKEAWFGRISRAEFERKRNGAPVIFFIDTAYTDKTSNDPTGIIGACPIGGNLYVTCAKKVNMKFPELCRFIPRYVRDNGYTSRSSIRIEPKANGLSVIDQLAEYTGLNVSPTPSPKESKETRLNAASPFVECGRVFLVEGDWNGLFIDEVCGFPAKPHDEFVDLLCYAIDYHHSRHMSVSDEELLRDFL